MIIQADARLDIIETIAWYEEQRDGLGNQFRKAVTRVLDQIEVMPEAHRIVRGSARRAVISGFPYSVYYRIENEEAVVFAVVHGRRNPRDWQSRG